MMCGTFCKILENVTHVFHGDFATCKQERFKVKSTLYVALRFQLKAALYMWAHLTNVDNLYDVMTGGSLTRAQFFEQFK